MKRMFKILSICCLMNLAFSSYARSQNGVYMSASDFTSKKLSYGIDSKIHLNHSVLELPYITVIDHGKKSKVDKDKIFGYADHDKVYRFYKKAEYQVVEAGNIYIYLQTERIPQSKGFKIKMNYYFSTSPSGEIIRLTLNDLKNAYRTNDKFLDLLDQFFNNGDVTGYDNIHRTYKVNYVYNKALK